MAKQVSRTRKFLGSIFRIRSWLDVERIRDLTHSLALSIKTLFTPPERTLNSQKNNRQENKAFERAAEKFQLSNQELTKTQRSLLYWSYSMIFFAIILLGVLGYYIHEGALKASLVSLMGVGLAIVLAFRYHFFYFQVKQRKLGCTIKEWFEQGLLGRKE